MDENEVSNRVIGAAIEVHRHLGPGLLESVYRDCLGHELRTQGIIVQQEVILPVRYKGLELETGYRIDLLVQELMIVELKAVDILLPILYGTIVVIP